MPDVAVIDAGGGNRVVLASGKGFDGNPTWAPDSTKIAFETERDGNREVYVMTNTGAGLTRVTNHPAYDGEPAWSPTR